MKKFVIIGLLCICSLGSFAAEWIKIDERVSVMFDKYQDGKVYYWTQMLNDGTMKPIKKKKVASQVVYNIDDCVNNTATALNGYAYDASGTVIDGGDVSSYSYKPVLPNTYGETLHNYVCKESNHPKATTLEHK